MVENFDILIKNLFSFFFLTEKGKTKENKGLKYPLGCTVRITVRKMKRFFELDSCDVNPERSFWPTSICFVTQTLKVLPHLHGLMYVRCHM